MLELPLLEWVKAEKEASERSAWALIASAISSLGTAPCGGADWRPMITPQVMPASVISLSNRSIDCCCTDAGRGKP